MQNGMEVGTSRTLGENQKDPFDNSFRLAQASDPEVTILDMS
jgi:hypothetical protein